MTSHSIKTTDKMKADEGESVDLTEEEMELETRVFDSDGDVIFILAKDAKETLTLANREIRDRQVCHMRVCSKTVGLASVVFKNMLQGAFRESATLKTAGSVEIPLPDDDIEALTILLNIIHHRTRKVPRTVDQPTLSQLACLVDKYCFHEAVEAFSAPWVNNVKPDVSGNHNFVELMTIYYCFHNPAKFKDATDQAIRRSTRNLEAFHLPVPTKYLDAANGKRMSVITQVFSHLNDVLKRYRGCDTICGHICDCTQLGAFTKELSRLGILEQPKCPYDGYSVTSIMTNVRTIGTPVCFSPQYRANNIDPVQMSPANPKFGFTSSKSHTQTDIDNALRKLEAGIAGLDICSHSGFGSPMSVPPSSSGSGLFGSFGGRD